MPNKPDEVDKKNERWLKTLLEEPGDTSDSSPVTVRDSDLDLEGLLVEYQYVVEHIKKAVLAQRKGGVLCPICNQTVKITRKRLTAQVAASVIWIYKNLSDWVSMKNFPVAIWSPSTVPTAAIWGFVEERYNVDPNFKKRGYWRVTDKGVKFVLGEIKVKEFALYFQGESAGYGGRSMNVTEVIGDSYDLDLLMAGTDHPKTPLILEETDGTF